MLLLIWSTSLSAALLSREAPTTGIAGCLREIIFRILLTPLLLSPRVGGQQQQPIPGEQKMIEVAQKALAVER